MASDPPEGFEEVVDIERLDDEAAALEEYEEGVRKREQAEEDWVDAVVTEQERLAETRQKERQSIGPSATASIDERASSGKGGTEWTGLLAGFGLSVVRDSRINK